MPTTTITLDSPDIFDDPVDLLSTSEFVQFPTKFACLPDDDGNGDGVSSSNPEYPCQRGCGDERAFVMIVEPGDKLPLQFHVPDLANADPLNPSLGWREDGDSWWVGLEVCSLGGEVVWEGPTYEIADSYHTGIGAAGTYQNVVVNVDKVLEITGLSCFFIRLKAFTFFVEYNAVNSFGSWASDTVLEGVPIGTMAINTHPDHFGLWELTGSGWEFRGYPEDGALYWIADSGSWRRYHAASVIYTAHGAAVGGAFSVSKGALEAAFEEVATEDITSEGVEGGITEGIRMAPNDVTKAVGVWRTQNRWAGSGPVGGALSAPFVTQDGGTFTFEGGTSAGAHLGQPGDPVTTRVAWARDTSGAVAMVITGDVGNSHPSWLVKSTDNGATWGFSDFIGFGNGNRMQSLAYYGTEVAAADTSGNLYYSTNGGSSWAMHTLLPGFQAPILGRMNGDRLLAVCRGGSPLFSINNARGTNNGGATWSTPASFPSPGFAWTPTDIVSYGDTVWVFGVGINAPRTGVLMRSLNNGVTWENLPAGAVLGGRADVMGYNTLIATGLVQQQPGGAVTRPGTLFVSYDGGESWDECEHQPAGGAESVAGRVLPGTWEVVDGPDIAEPGDAPFDHLYTMTYRVRRCNERIVRFQSTGAGRDCNGFIHDIADIRVDKANGDGEPVAFQYDFKLAGSLEVQSLPITRERTENGKLLSVVTQTTALLRLKPLPEAIARLLQAVAGNEGFLVNGERWDELDALAKNNENGAHWHISTVLKRDDCDRDTRC